MFSLHIMYKPFPDGDIENLKVKFSKEKHVKECIENIIESIDGSISSGQENNFIDFSEFKGIMVYEAGIPAIGLSNEKSFKKSYFNLNSYIITIAYREENTEGVD